MIGCQKRHANPPVALELQRALGGQAADRLAHRGHARAQPVGQALNCHRLPRGQVTEQHQIAQFPIDHLMRGKAPFRRALGDQILCNFGHAFSPCAQCVFVIACEFSHCVKTLPYCHRRNFLIKSTTKAPTRMPSNGRPSMRNLILTATATLALGAMTAQAEEVRVYNWSDYIDEDLLTKFEEETGLDLVYDVFDSNELLETKMLAGGSGYDVVVPSGSFLLRQIQAGAFQKLDKSQLPNLDNMWDVVRERTAASDPGHEYSINYMWGTTGIGVNVGKVREVLGEDAPIDSLDLVFDPANMEKLAECGVHFLDAPAEIIPAALQYIGEDPDSKDEETLAKAEPVLMAVRP